MNMEIKLLKSEGDCVRLQTLGKVSRDGWKTDQNPICDLCGEGIFGRRVLLNLQESQYLDSTGVEWLLHTHRRFQENGGMLVIHSVTPVMQQILKMMRMDALLNLAADEPAAQAFATANNGSHP
jgi:anti-anti-sigma factor